MEFADWLGRAGRALAVLVTLPIMGFLVFGWIGALFALVMGLLIVASGETKTS